MHLNWDGERKERLLQILVFCVEQHSGTALEKWDFSPCSAGEGGSSSELVSPNSPHPVSLGIAAETSSVQGSVVFLGQKGYKKFKK